MTTTNPPAATPVAPASTPPLVTVPTLTITTVGGLAVPVSPVGTYTSPDVTLPNGTTNSVVVTVAAANVPVGTVFTVKVIPASDTERYFVTGPSTGTVTASTATATVNFPYNQTSLLYAYASIPLTANLFPLIDGEPVEHMLIATSYGEPSTVTLFTRSGKPFR